MRWILPALLLMPAQEEKTYDAFRTRVAEAKTLRAECTVQVTEGARTFATLRMTLKIKGANRFSLTYESARIPFREDREEKGSILCDGRKIVTTGGRGRANRTDPPDVLTGDLRACLTSSMFAVYALVERPRKDERFVAEVSDLHDRGKTKVGDVDARLIEYSLSYSAWSLKDDKLATKLYLSADGSRVLRREMTIQGVQWTEVYDAFALDEDLPDSDFSFQSLRRLSRARGQQVARSVELHGRFTGRHPESLEALLRRPDADTFWPEGGFVLGGAIPDDGWGRPFVLSNEKGNVSVVSLGADGRTGGRGDEEDIVVPVPPVTRRAVGAPTEELRKHFSARVHLHLLVGAVAAFREAYGELPRKKAALWERPDWAEVWPEGGWIGGTSLPKDPWGQPYRLISDPGSVRAQIQDPFAHRISWKQLTADEKRLLEETARPRFTDGERKSIQSTLERLCDDDLDVREEAELELMAWGAAIVPFLQEHLKTETDSEASARLQKVLRSIRMPPVEWKVELGALALILGEGSGDLFDNERMAVGALKTIATAQADFRSNDRDNNRVNDFWAGDIAGLYAIAPGGQAIKLIEASTALADPAAMEGGKVPCYPNAITKHGEAAPRAGYHFRALREDRQYALAYAQDTDGTGEKVRNTSRFGACAFPAEYGVDGTKTFIINEGNTIFWKDTGGEPVLDWPTDHDLAEGWAKLD